MGIESQLPRYSVSLRTYLLIQTLFKYISICVSNKNYKKLPVNELYLVDFAYLHIVL